MVLKWLFVGDTGGRDCTLIIQVSRDTEFLQSVELHSKDGLEMAWLYLEDCLEMTVHR